MNTPLKSKFISELEEKLTHENINTVTALIKERLMQQSPIIEDIPNDASRMLVTFLYEIEKENDIAYFMSILNNMPIPIPMQRLGLSTFSYCSIPVLNHIRTSYAFGLNMLVPSDPSELLKNEKSKDEFARDFGTKSRFDPYNPKKISFHDAEVDLHFQSSLLEMPDAAPAIWSEKNASAPRGEVAKHLISSKLLKAEQHYWVYTPAGYDSTKSYPMIVLFDGEMHIENPDTGLITAFDNLIFSGQIAPMVAVLVKNTSMKLRNRDLMCDENFASYLMDELLPSVKKEYSISGNRNDCVIAGASLGGLFSLYVALRYPSQFGKVLCNSPAFWASKIQCKDILDKLIEQNRQPKLRVYMDLGVLETVKCGEVEMIKPVNHIKVLLQKFGHQVKYHTFAGGHDLFCHVETIPEALIWLLRKRSINHP